MKRVLLVNPRRKNCAARNPSIGLATLAAVLKQADYKVLVVDYQFTHSSRPLEDFIEDFQADAVGFSLFTPNMDEAERLIDAVSKFKLPVLVGGPHATLYCEDLENNRNIDYIVKGEAETVISDIIASATKQNSPKVIESGPVNNIDSLPFPDFTSFYDYSLPFDYPWITSRGCPYNCIFCSVHLLNSKTWRRRSPHDCIEELIFAKRILPNLKGVAMFDDSIPDKGHLAELLQLYIKNRINLPLAIVNTRADIVDEEILSLLKQCNCLSINFGVEHGDPDIFKSLDKGETIEDIKRAAGLVKRYGMGLYLCFIIGLPGDSLDKIKHSISLAKELQPDEVMWNMLIPYRGTKVRTILEKDKNTKIFNERGRSSYVDGDFLTDGACIETPDFTKFQREKAYYMAILKTGHPRLRLSRIPQIIFIIAKYGLCPEFLGWLTDRIKKSRLQYFLH